jgi:hypothetical protein
VKREKLWTDKIVTTSKIGRNVHSEKTVVLDQLLGAPLRGDVVVAQFPNLEPSRSIARIGDGRGNRLHVDSTRSFVRAIDGTRLGAIGVFPKHECHGRSLRDGTYASDTDSSIISTCHSIAGEIADRVGAVAWCHGHPDTSSITLVDAVDQEGGKGRVSNNYLRTSYESCDLREQHVDSAAESISKERDVEMGFQSVKIA